MNLHYCDRWSREQSDDLSENWEDYPTFGSYTSLCRAERLPATRSTATDHL